MLGTILLKMPKQDMVKVRSESYIVGKAKIKYGCSFILFKIRYSWGVVLFKRLK